MKRIIISKRMHHHLWQGFLRGVLLAGIILVNLDLVFAKALVWEDVLSEAKKKLSHLENEIKITVIATGCSKVQQDFVRPDTAAKQDGPVIEKKSLMSKIPAYLRQEKETKE